MTITTTAKCLKCGGSSIADTFEQARKLINHAVGLSRGIKCGDNYNKVVEIKPKEYTVTTKTKSNVIIPATEDTSEKTISEKPNTLTKKEIDGENTIIPTQTPKKKLSKKE